MSNILLNKCKAVSLHAHKALCQLGTPIRPQESKGDRRRKEKTNKQKKDEYLKNQITKRSWQKEGGNRYWSWIILSRVPSLAAILRWWWLYKPGAPDHFCNVWHRDYPPFLPLAGFCQRTVPVFSSTSDSSSSQLQGYRFHPSPSRLRD